MKPSGLTESAALFWLDQLAHFCATAGRKCYGAFSPEVLRDYLTFHIRQETLAWARGMQNAKCKMQNGHIAAVGIAWQCDAEDVIRAAVAGKHFFDWQPTNPHGNALFLADVVATTPAGALALMQRAVTRFPNWQQLHLYTFRAGKLRCLSPRLLGRFCARQHQMTLLPSPSLRPAGNLQPLTKD